MEDMSNLNEVWPGVVDALLDAKAVKPVVLDLEGLCSWADCMVIVTASSGAHMRGLSQKVLEYLKDKPHYLPVNGRGLKGEEQWLLMDCNSLVINIMSAQAREYYDLEKLWFQAEVLFSENQNSSSL